MFITERVGVLIKNNSKQTMLNFKTTLINKFYEKKYLVILDDNTIMCRFW